MINIPGVGVVASLLIIFFTGLIAANVLGLSTIVVVIGERSVHRRILGGDIGVPRLQRRRTDRRGCGHIGQDKIQHRFVHCGGWCSNWYARAAR